MAQTGLTYDDLLRMYPEETNDRIEIIGGELFVTPAPTVRHQRALKVLAFAFHQYTDERGGEHFFSPLDTMFTESDVVQPDLIYFAAEKARQIEERPVTVVPDLVAEVSSPSTRSIDLGRKRDLYERHGVREYWFVDLDADRIEVHRLEGDRFGDPAILSPSDTLTSPLLPGFSVEVADIIPPRS